MSDSLTYPLCSVHLPLSLFVSSPLQGCEVFGQAHGPGHGQEGESHHTVCHRDGQIAGLCQNSLWNLQARIWRKGTLAPTLHHLIRKLNRSWCVSVPTSNWKRNSKTSLLYPTSIPPPLPPPPPRLALWLTKPSRCQLSAGDETVEEESVSFVTFPSSLMQQSAAGQRQDLTIEALSSAVV